MQAAPVAAVLPLTRGGNLSLVGGMKGMSTLGMAFWGALEGAAAAGFWEALEGAGLEV